MTNESSPRARHFKRRRKAAEEGLYLPTEEELLRGMTFFRERLVEDLREYASRLGRRIRKRGEANLEPLAAVLDELTVEQSSDAVRSLETMLDIVEEPEGISFDDCRLRCRFYLACFGDPGAAAAVAAEIASLALVDTRTRKGREMLWRSLSWATHSRQLAKWERSGVVRSAGRGVQFHPDFGSYEYQFKAAILDPGPEERKEQDSPPGDLAVPDPEQEVSAADAEATGAVIVVSAVGNDATPDGKRVVQEFEKVMRRPLPLRVTPDLTVVRANLVEEFPYAASIVEALLKRLVGHTHVHLRPTILLGTPGCGKTRFARRLAEELRTPYELVSCGGLSDSAIGGTARRWSSGEPSLPVMVVRRDECAGPVIILDEIEKVGTSRHNGNVHDVLIGLFEPETSSRWHDPYVQARCNLSNLTWLMTANAIEPVPTVLRDRCRIIRFPEPGPEHLRFLAASIMQRLYGELGYDPRWITPLEGFELEALAGVWQGGSIRKLERLVEGLIDAREHQRRRH